MTRVINGYPIIGIPANLKAGKDLPSGFHLEFAIIRSKNGFRVVRSPMMGTNNFMDWDAGFIPVGTSDKIRTEEQFEDAIFSALEKRNYFMV